MLLDENHGLCLGRSQIWTPFDNSVAITDNLALEGRVQHNSYKMMSQMSAGKNERLALPLHLLPRLPSELTDRLRSEFLENPDEEGSLKRCDKLATLYMTRYRLNAMNRDG